jgi:3-hydroxybutyryl-CoA dehydrogenase
MIKTVSVIGAGTMGNGIAHVFAQNGFSVTLVDVNPVQLTRAMETIGKNLDRQEAKGLIDATQKAATLANIQTASKSHKF